MASHAPACAREEEFQNRYTGHGLNIQYGYTKGRISHKQNR